MRRILSICGELRRFVFARNFCGFESESNRSIAAIIPVELDEKEATVHKKEGELDSSVDKWTNPVVQAFARGNDPIESIRDSARTLVLKAMELGWQGPPFDPFDLASLMDIRLKANASVNDALLRQDGNGRNLIEYNPNRHISRLRFSIAHEIAHTFFPNFTEKTQFRGKSYYSTDDWEIESLCNIAAAEILMPIGTTNVEFDDTLRIEAIMELRRKYAVSSEAMLIHISKLQKFPCAAFCASRIDKDDPNSEFQINYLMGNQLWKKPIKSQTKVRRESILDECQDIGFTSRGIENLGIFQKPKHIECVGLPPYPGSKFPRVAGLIFEPESISVNDHDLEFRHGDASNPFAEGKKVIAHVVNDKARRWGGRGFSSALAKRYPGSLEAYSKWFSENGGNKGLGTTHFYEASDDICIASMVAQKGYGKSPLPRIRYEALEECLGNVSLYCRNENYSLHAPRIGAGQAGGNWLVIEEMLRERAYNDGVSITIYDLPPRR